MSDIDAVIFWVDGNDQKWLDMKSRYDHRFSDDRQVRYRDYGLLKYWFRGIEKNMPWLRKVFFISMNQIPEWLNTDNPKLECLNHDDFIPSKYLPTFNANTIELNLHRIRQLSEKFILFNDDMFIIDKVREEDYFIDNKPVDMLALQPIIANNEDEIMSYIYLNNAIILSRYFDKKENMKKQPKAYFNISYPLKYFVYNNLERLWPKYTGFFTAHSPSPLLKSTLVHLWEKEPEILDTTSTDRFRSRNDVNQYLVREYQKLKGDFVSKNIIRNFAYFDLDNENRKLLKCLKNRSVPSLCINDSNREIEFDRIKKELKEAFEDLLPEKSSFEK